MVASIPIDTSNNGSNQLGEFYITEPIHDGTTYIMGDGVSWINGVPGPLTINVLEGDDPSDMMPTQLSSTETAELGSGTFTLPVNSAFDESKTYCFQLVYGDGQSSYSARFKVTSEGIRGSTDNATPSDSNSTPNV
ncbi:hypothetical protein G6F46_000249 [Rhizopus delemar]|uniref:Uncharacterized protein n=2 Tax=Rhizopus TaxID=4842 RepID=A0A9P6ZEA9_9FUNG|nr:hypothetical protein G6F55_000145 [Rhizopus delemar]KAG1553513.1 hypothetical protein G6F51_000547 [Rhizopus arrhizus]KAG1495556.1 hypothetical protein G6F52_013026 [Rhizopus delemar]KAG1503924.1 hypothetical protein G6F54_001349 [Rhizopus delemar]KAG1512347.1 hypothetical protein G6F53_005248 [Rhizopus delemar]